MDIFLQILDENWLDREGFCTGTVKSVSRWDIYLKWIAVYRYIVAPLWCIILACVALQSEKNPTQLKKAKASL